MNIGRLLNSILAKERIGKAGEEREQERYARIVIPLDRAEYVGTNIELHLKGDYIGRIKYDGSATGCYFKLNNRHSGRIYAGEFRRTYSEYDRIYLTNPSSQSGKQLILTVGGAFSSEIEPSSGGKTGLQNSSGVDINPAEKDEYDTVLGEIEGAVETVEEAIKVDDAAFTPASSKVIVIGAECDDTTPNDVDEGDAGALRMDAARSLHVKEIFGGAVFNASITLSDNAKAAVGSVKLRDVVIKNTHATENIIVGEDQTDVATMRTTDFILKAGASIGFTMVDLATLFRCNESDGETPTIKVIGVEI